MSKKDKKNKKGQSSNNNSNVSQNINSVPAQSVTPDQENRIIALDESVSENSAKHQTGTAPLNTNDSAKIIEAERTNDLRKYLKYLEEINARINPLLAKADEISIKERSIVDQQNQLNKQRVDLLKRESDLDTGKYKGTISGLLDDLENAEKEISGGMHRLLEYIVKQSIDLAEEEKKLCDDKINLEKLKRNFEYDKKFIKEQAENNAESKYFSECEEAKSIAKSLKAKVETLTNEINVFRSIKTFLDQNNSTPEEILLTINKIQEENKNLCEELINRPTDDDLKAKKDQISILETQLKIQSGKINEQELNELRARIDSNDAYVLEIQAYKDRLESSKSREESFQKTIEDLQSTINQLKGEREKDEEAFQYAQKYDKDSNLKKKAFSDNNPPTLKDFAEYMQNKIYSSSEKGFAYSLDTIRIFISGIYMSPITILQGISGTGKTSLPREFAEAIISAPEYKGKNKENLSNAPYRICAIQSGWRDNMDLIGYYNSFEHKYKETDFFKALYLANLPKYSDTLFFIILDEMNLSRPEHYFADFLSLLEQDEGRRYITINAPFEVLPKQIEEGKLKVPKNVRFIGTANHDETTLEFAPKTYDRSNIMELPKKKPSIKTKEINDSYNISYSWLEYQFNAAAETYADEYKQFEAFINSDGLKVLLAEKGIGIGNRFEAQAKRFVSVFIATGDPRNRIESLAKATDHLIATRLLRTLRNRYDLNKDNLQKFKDDYSKEFKSAFNSCEPVFANELLKEEIEKK